ncbi:hypothetical protein CCE01nite_36870 [Cellulomonas cellasea]|uniref:Uncharacterized protein n=2 Tax=Cellulomonas cellasea TaxID=43670 RepID=A0A4Y3L4H2_9CELL|nr:hypothetical protein CCE01nite_36870 [Cellulomonas cellasea]
MEPTGVVVLAMTTLWIAYLVPHKLRYRQQLLESRADDRFSGALRVLAVTGPRGREARRDAEAAARAGAGADCGPTTEKRAGLLTPSRGVPLLTAGRGGGTAVDRPHGTQDRISADAARRAAQRRAAHAAAVARRGAAARRRAVLALALLVATAAGWTVVGLTAVTVVAGIVPSVLLTGVLVLGRRAVLAGRAADAEWEQRRHEAPPVTGAVPLVRNPPAAAPARGAAGPSTAPAGRGSGVKGRAVHPSDAHTEVFSRIVDDVEGTTAARAPMSSAGRPATGAIPVVKKTETGAQPTVTADAAAEGADGEPWSPVPVPRPTYTTKAAAPRREPAPLGEVEGSTAVAAESVGNGRVEVPAAESRPGARADERAPLEAPPATTGSMNLDEILARRRAAGE